MSTQAHSKLWVAAAVVPNMTMATVDVSEVYRHICYLNIHKAVEVDKIPTGFIYASPNGMAVILTDLINKSITDITFLIFGKMLLWYQFKNLASLSNFHPITSTILPVFSKLLEKVVFNQLQLVNHFTTYDLVSNKQSGFRNGYSTQDALLCYVTDAWLKEIDIYSG